MLKSFRDIQRMVGGFQAAKMILTANDLGLFLEISNQARSTAELAASLKVDQRALGLLLNALTSIGFLLKEDGRFRNHPVVYEHLGDKDNYRGSIFRHLHHCWGSWNHLPEVLRNGQPDFAAERNSLGENDEWTADFIQGMNDVTRELAPVVVQQLELDQVDVLMDVGGGPGTYAAAFRQAWPDLKEIKLFDLPDALAIGRENLKVWGTDEHVSFHSGDFNRDALPGSVDAIWMSQVLHSQDEAGCQALIEKAFAALNPGGRLMIHEFLLNDDYTAPTMAAIFSVHMLVMTEGGRAYNGTEISDWMAAAGFKGMSVRSVSDETSVVTGLKPQ